MTWKRWNNACRSRELQHCFPTVFRYSLLHAGTAHQCVSLCACVRMKEVRPATCPDPRLCCGTTSEPARPKPSGTASVRPREPVVGLCLARLCPRPSSSWSSARQDPSASHTISPKSRRQCDARAEEGTLAKCKNTARCQHSHLSGTSPDHVRTSPGPGAPLRVVGGRH